jgi:hypothetical protein
MTLAGFLVRTNYQDPPNPDIVERAGCPTTALRRASAHAAGVYDQGGPAS